MKMYRISKDSGGLWRISGEVSNMIKDYVVSKGIANYIDVIGGRVGQVDSPILCSCGNIFPHTGVLIECDGFYELVVEDV